MAVRLRLTRMGKKKQPFYRIVAVDSRVKRDGKYLESIGYYNPIPDPFELQIDTERALYWLKQGAQPSDTVRSLMRRKGIMLRWDLIRRGKSPEEIEAEVKKWEEIQQEKLKRLEAERIQKQRSQKKEKAEAAPASEPAEAEEQAAGASASEEAAAETAVAGEATAEPAAAEAADAGDSNQEAAESSAEAPSDEDTTSEEEKAE